MGTEGGCCTVIDAGLTTRIGEDITVSFREFILASATGNARLLVDKLKEFNVSGDELTPEHEQNLLVNIQSVCDEWINEAGTAAPDGGPISLGDVMGAVMHSCFAYNIVLRGDVANSMMALGVSEGLVRSLDPEFDVVKSSLPYFVKYKVLPPGMTLPGAMGDLMNTDPSSMQPSSNSTFLYSHGKVWYDYLRSQLISSSLRLVTRWHACAP